jgi:hypothetical protein
MGPEATMAAAVKEWFPAKGSRVASPGGPGTVAYVRMAPPDWTHIEAVSVRLDACVGRLGYSGTIYLACDVMPLDETDRAPGAENPPFSGEDTEG